MADETLVQPEGKPPPISGHTQGPVIAMSDEVYNELAIGAMTRAEWAEFHRLHDLLSDAECSA